MCGGQAPNWNSLHSGRLATIGHDGFHGLLTPYPQALFFGARHS
jgi:hypothetical protein